MYAIRSYYDRAHGVEQVCKTAQTGAERLAGLLVARVAMAAEDQHARVFQPRDHFRAGAFRRQRDQRAGLRQRGKQFKGLLVEHAEPVGIVDSYNFV